MKIDNDFNDIDALGDSHIGSSSDTPMRDDAFELSKEEKIDIIKLHKMALSYHDTHIISSFNEEKKFQLLRM